MPSTPSALTRVERITLRFVYYVWATLCIAALFGATAIGSLPLVLTDVLLSVLTGFTLVYFCGRYHHRSRNATPNQAGSE
jgi:hypothetical protein